MCNGLKYKSCGCTQYTENIGNYKHGGKGAKLYAVWKHMKQRILNPNDKGYKDYGGRGIIICPEWTNDYIVFRDWALSNGYQEGLEINRILNDGNYEPNNCNFVPRKENNRNQRNTITMEIANEIRYLWNTGNFIYKQLAYKYNVRQQNISKIITNKIWKN